VTGFDVENSVRRLIDEADVARIVLSYADAIDRREFERVTALFAPDAHIVGTFGEGPVADYLPQLFGRVNEFGATQHLIANQIVTVGGDSASIESYAIARHFVDAAGTIEALTVGIRYDDWLDRNPDGRWLITRRVVVTTWSRTGAGPSDPTDRHDQPRTEAP
jgi:ketosteroid isomerase-like protein